MAKSLSDLKSNFVVKYTIGLMMKGEGTSMLRTELSCDVCGETCLAWEVHQIPYYPEGKLSENYEAGYTMMACDKCIEEKHIIPLDTDASVRFDASNLAIKEILETRKDQQQ
ncbi:MULTISPECIES: hypothetical protein [Desulfitobacterium]|uniref:Uncharacterized protein n=1 Tax=Desulfitobacterium dehalogenans (strain ATCC 51507 / DSM 9161 / JW/IU-DC1) TaxID=756499 RepID=I4A5W8_DESDJ|nr:MULTISPECIES: hypothetical protein [Desulfitobacterium]AFL99352.1 hypothetical protein Desde_0916 [Desulfitobacterium dehalogenans ATCC 51507]